MYSDDEYYEEWMMFTVLKMKSMKLLKIWYSFRIIKLVVLAPIVDPYMLLT